MYNVKHINSSNCSPLAFENDAGGVETYLALPRQEDANRPLTGVGSRAAVWVIVDLEMYRYDDHNVLGQTVALETEGTLLQELSDSTKQF